MLKYIFILFLVVFILAYMVVSWQSGLSKNTYSNIYGRQSAGTEWSAAYQYAYFYYYLNLFPLLSDYPTREYSREGAQRLLENYPTSLYFDTQSHITWGSYFSNTLVVLASHIKGTPLEVNLLSLNKILFIIALLIMLGGFWLHKKYFLGISIMLLLGSALHQLYEVYGRSNIFSYNLNLFMICLALSLPLLYSKSKYLKYYLCFIALLLGILFMTFANARTEVMTGLLPLILFVIFTPNLRRIIKVAGLFILLIGIIYANTFWATYYQNLFDKTFLLVEQMQGRSFLYKPISTQRHVFWHAVAVGMADIKQDRGYSDLLDNTQAEYSRQELLTRDFEKFSMISKNKWMTTPEHAEIMKRRVLNDIIHDPLWYLSILLGRVHVMCTKLPPVTISFGSHIYSSYVSGYIFIPVLLLFIYIRDYKRLLILISSLANSITTVFITTAWNTPAMAIFHLFALALLADFLHEKICHTKFMKNKIELVINAKMVRNLTKLYP